MDQTSKIYERLIKLLKAPINNAAILGKDRTIIL
jgi:hypothetical protein